jgi:two-component system LytT family response regulator
VRSVTETLGAGALALVHAPSASLRALVAEPDPVSRRLICSLLNSELIAVVESPNRVHMLDAIKESVPDILVADALSLSPSRAEIPVALGSEVPAATIVTAYDPADLPAFAPIAVDLLVKPFDADRFEVALDLAKSEITRGRALAEKGEFLSGKQGDLPRTGWLERLVVESDHKMLLVRAEDIDWIQSSGDYVRLHVGSACHLLRRTMKELQALLDPKRFLRVHRSAMVNLDRVKEFYLPPTGNMFVTLKTGVSLPLRRHTRFSLRRLLKDIS